MNIYHEFLSLVREATLQRRIKWKKNEHDEFVARGKIEVVIRQIIPFVAGPNETIGPQAFEVQAANVIFTSWSGSECSDIIHDILGEAFPDWAEHQASNAKKLIDA